MKLNLTIATFATLLSVGSLSAQQTPPGQLPASSSQVKPNSSVDAPLTKEQVFAKCLAITNQEEVTMAKYAKEKSTSEEVKALATVLEKAHQESLDELKAFASKATANKKPSNPTSPVANNNANVVDFVQMHQEMSDQCLKDGKEMLSKKEGADFDACFVGMQIAKHSMMHSSLTVLQRHTAGDLQAFIKANLARNDEHMQAAIALMEQQSDKAVARTAKAK